MKNKSLEEAAIKYAEYNEFLSDRPFEFKRDKVAFINGAEWQQERSYSEEELEVAYFECREGLYSFNDWFEQFKKK